MFSRLRLLYYLLKPRTIFLRRTSNGLGDNLLMSMLLPELRRKYPNHKIVVETPWKDLFVNNPNADWVTDKHFKTTARHIKPRYHIDRDTEVSIYEQIMGYAGEARKGVPELYLSDVEIRSIAERFPGRYIAICPTGKNGFSANRKEWGLANFQRLRDLLAGFQFVQIGLPTDPLLQNAVDGRHLSVRETAAAIRNSLFFIGLEGGLMHLARSVGQRSVIIYGGLVRPRISAYEENLNVYNGIECSPCFHSDYSHKPCESMACMKGISPEMVHDMICRRFLSPEHLEA